ncbi:FAD/NAD(P)-binding domain-containing protein [Streptomyces sp. FH025]|uniref:FAD/NAD(P)-binding protein n=1 Tax=Streptomyces sp. FH025 TaxID=2815937 RepID=UPI001AA001AA|nr:FAD/NAD(P)-binding domain-containing protein [Streptomyces sp. FH025]MBO1414781.1 FAD/NAD(P)-binding protein [Streptomyces sp. FH025]
MKDSIRFDVCVIGAGPRGLSVLERICANARERGEHTRITVHVVDPYPAGAGQVWRTDQSRHLLMNTVASQVSMFTDPSTDIEGPIEGGPSLYEWAGFVRAVGSYDGYDGYGDQTLAEARDLGPDDYPTRALYGHYLEWVFRRVVGTAPWHLTVAVHRDRAVELRGRPDGTQTVRLAGGEVIDGLAAVVLAQGHLGEEPDDEQRRAARFAERHGLFLLPPGNPADADLTALAPGRPVLLRGLGLNFFDYLALLTQGRGGTYLRQAGRLVYRPSGREPRIYAGSRRGVPHHARGENEKGPYGRHRPAVLTPEAVARLRAEARAGAGLDFRRDLWPLIAKEVETVYYTALVRARYGERAAEAFRLRYLAVEHGSAPERALLDAAEVAHGPRFDWERLARPYGDREFASPAEFRRWLLEHLRADAAAAREGNVTGPLKAALDVLRDLRNEIRPLVDHGGLTAGSHRDDLRRWYTPLNAFLSIGPPARRIEEMTALIEAGVLTVLGPGTTVRPDEAAGAFVADSPAVPGSRVAVSALIEARLPEPELDRVADPLLRGLLKTGRCRRHRVDGPDGESHLTGGLDVTERPYHLLDAAGWAHPARFAFGVPTEAVHWVTAAGIRPGVNSVTLQDSDAIARAVLDRAGAGAAVAVAVGASSEETAKVDAAV